VQTSAKLRQQAHQLTGLIRQAEAEARALELSPDLPGLDCLPPVDFEIRNKRNKAEALRRRRDELYQELQRRRTTREGRPVYRCRAERDVDEAGLDL
jgi:hypothetical protein